MSEQDYNEIYETMKNNSIGEEKKATVNSDNKKTVIKIAAGVLIAVLATAGIIALFTPKKDKSL